ncbi:hypothetical protein Hdeb2414_s0008g00266351 [Helianthus debilis subsp. tardiflorus]
MFHSYHRDLKCYEYMQKDGLTPGSNSQTNDSVTERLDCYEFIRSGAQKTKICI